MSMHSARLTPGSLVGGRYEVVREVGRGGVSIVFLARDVKLATEVALKVSEVPGPLYEDFRLRFRREARLGARLGKEQGFVRALDWGEVEPDRSLYLALDYVPDAAPLQLRSGPLEQRLRTLLSAARLVEQVHRLGIVHRDIKPDNFLVDPQGRVFLADFGLGKELDAKPSAEEEERQSYRTGTGFTLGTPLFMSPEQFGETRDVGTRTDVYALGVMLFYCLTGQFPYPGMNAMQVMSRQMEVRYKGLAPPSPASADPSIPPALVKLCLAAMHLDPAQRPGADGLVRGLEAALDAAPTMRVPRPPSARHPAAPGGGAPTGQSSSSGRLPALDAQGKPPAPRPSSGVGRAAPGAPGAGRPGTGRIPPPAATPAAPSRPTPFPTPPPGSGPNRAQLRIDAGGLASRDVLWRVRRDVGREAFRQLIGGLCGLRIADERPLKGVDASGFLDRLAFLLPRPQVGRPADAPGVVVGRAQESDVVLPFSTVSKRQLGFEQLANGDWTVVELGSRNGTRLNGVALGPDVPRVLSEGDSLCLSEHLILEFLTPPRIVEWVEEVGDSSGGTAGEVAGGLGGKFKGDELVEFLQMVEFNRKTGVLRIHDTVRFRGTAFFQEGRLKGASTQEGQKGEAGLRSLLSLPGGRFRFSPQLPVGFAPELDLPLSPILFEAMRQRDEAVNKSTQVVVTLKPEELEESE